MVKKRLDILLVELQLVESRSLAQRMVMAGKIRVDGEVVLKSSTQVFEKAKVEVMQAAPFVSRGGGKLAAALDAFQLSVRELTCADVGCSTGGFTDCMLQRGARHVYAIDVGKGILEWKLRTDARVTVMEGVNARYLEKLAEEVDFVAIDVSFISLKKILPVILKWGKTQQVEKEVVASRSNIESDDKRPPSIEAVVLIKPQFEAGRVEVARGEGVIRDAAIHKRVLLDILSFAQQSGYSGHGLIRSPLVGPKGNIEFLCWLKFPACKGATPAELIAGMDYENQAGR
jgi:23S rRNA (cytidine1920-2'-O)/16S rRNA (cytidine1409-2'-O)-methyltransferase